MTNQSLKEIIFDILAGHQNMTVRQVLLEINALSEKVYSYSTVATILRRLESEGSVAFESSKEDNRKIRTYFIPKDAHEKEVHAFLSNLITRFGMSGMKHLGAVLDVEITNTTFEKLQKQLGICIENP